MHETDEIIIGAKHAATDSDKCKILLEYIGCNDVKFSDCFRLGKEVIPGKPRPIKISFSDKNTAFTVLGKTMRLKELRESHNQNVYIKPDKTKSEVAEFQRLGKKKGRTSYEISYY